MRARLFGHQVIVPALVACAACLALAACSSVPRRIAPPQANLLRLEAAESAPAGRRFAFDLTILNPNPEEIPVVRMDYDVRLGPAGRLIGEYAMPFTLPSQDSLTLTIELVSDTVSSASQLMSFAVGPENALEYEFHGELFLDSRLREPVPLFQRGEVPLYVTISVR
ncbi:MAG TPA: LEA type 2 family protein [Gammaproteobacteria bacterium]